MSKMISVASGFQYSINIGYDLNNDEKIKNFIPTKSALNLLEDILMSTNANSTERARVLIGAYGKGKSHIVLMILSMLLKKDISLFKNLLDKVDSNSKLYQSINNYYESSNKILPVVISGSNTSLSQAFLLGLQRTLAENEMLDIMPETNYKAAVATIKRWQFEFPETFASLKNQLVEPIDKFIEALQDFDIHAYEKFERIYPSLTAGSTFNPFLGFDVIELYENAVKGLRSKGYSGIYVVYDEFSKFLEANIAVASVSDTKMLQDFAEKCNRSGENQLHLMLISHKEISNYIDILPKQKIDGWRGVSERFRHIHLNNNFSQTYEIIASVIQKKQVLWDSFKEKFNDGFTNIEQVYKKHSLFNEFDENSIGEVFKGCYPLHPVSMFVLPRLSERVAQNERTLFTFLSASGSSTLLSYLESYGDDKYDLISPDMIYDYFESLLKKEIYSGTLHDVYQLTSIILNRLPVESLESKIVKTLSLIYMLEQFEKLNPSKDTIVNVFSIRYTREEINEAINNLVEKEFVIYLKRSNDYLKLKQSSGVDIRKAIADTVEKNAGRFSVKDILNGANFDNYIYPSRYNDEKEMVRYFAFEFIAEEEIENNTNWSIKSEKIKADGVIYGVIPKNNSNISELQSKLLESSNGHNQFVFILPKQFQDISAIAQEYKAVSILKELVIDDAVLLDEYDVIYDDLREIINSLITTYTHPEEAKATYIHNGEVKSITRKATLTGLLSDICDDVYSLTPIVNNEALNRDELTSVANNSRNKLIAALLRNNLEHNLGLTGAGQEVSMMRSTLVRTGILETDEAHTKLNLNPSDVLIKNMLGAIIEFIVEGKEKGEVSLANLYERLQSPEFKIGLRKGLIPIYIGAVFHEYKKEIILQDRFGQVAINADTLVQINANPAGYSLVYLDWNPEKQEFISKLTDIFSDFIVEEEKASGAYEFVVSAMRRWYLSLSKYSKELKKKPNGEKVDKRYVSLLRLLKQGVSGHELLFEKLPKEYGYNEYFNNGLAENIGASKVFYDNSLSDLKKALISEVKKIFVLSQNQHAVNRMSLASVIKDWCDNLDAKVFEQLFTDGTEKLLQLFKTVTNDEETFVVRLAKLATSLRVEDWDEQTCQRFIEVLNRYKKTAEEFKSKDNIDDSTTANSYEVTFIDDDGKANVKRFDRVELSKRSKLLLNAINADIESMGFAITEQEKRQVLMEVLKNLC